MSPILQFAAAIFRARPAVEVSTRCNHGTCAVFPIRGSPHYSKRSASCLSRQECLTISDARKSRRELIIASAFVASLAGSYIDLPENVAKLLGLGYPNGMTTRAWAAGSLYHESVAGTIAIVRMAAEDLVSLQVSLKTSSIIGTSLPLKDMKRRITFGPLSQLSDAALKLDSLIDSTPLEDWETTAWTSVIEETQGSNYRNRDSRWRIPGVKRTNAFLCLVFSCFNDPRAPPSTDMILSLKLLSDGVDMGLRGDARISAEGLILSLDDALEKVNSYLELVNRSS